MTYPIFLVLFLVLPIAVLAFRLRRHAAAGWWRAAVALAVLLALLYTTPWDNYLVATRVWTYDPARVWNIVFGWVPLEEYLFFLLQPILGALVTLWLLNKNA